MFGDIGGASPDCVKIHASGVAYAEPRALRRLLDVQQKLELIANEPIPDTTGIPEGRGSFAPPKLQWLTTHDSCTYIPRYLSR